MTDTRAASAPVPDRAALAKIGRLVRERLAGDPDAYRVPVEQAEIHAVSDFLSPAECDRFIEMVDQVAEPSATFDPEVQAQFRTSYSGDVDRNDAFVQMIERRIDDLLGIDGSFGETVQGQRYTAGQEFQAHCDWFHTTAPYWPEQVRTGGQRSWTAMIYLNDVEEGGATEFVHLGVSVTPRQGMLLAWNNAEEDGAPNANTLHAARPVVRGVKYVITKWYRSRRWGYSK
ncbi:MAG TPA: 2OG-Fe(II) oxygenase [Novosphingobium sp.]|nr:2OG-Fe(II) oxygenase [Novosphingobium sp.]